MDAELRELIHQTEVILNINTKFLELISARIGTNNTSNLIISDILLQYAPMFKIYVAYLDAQPNGSTSFQRLIRRCDNLRNENIRL
jgi:hypothetical protein